MQCKVNLHWKIKLLSKVQASLLKVHRGASDGDIRLAWTDPKECLVRGCQGKKLLLRIY